MTDTPTQPSLYAKLADVTREVGHVEAKGFHSFLRTKYVTEDDLLDAVRDKLAARNVVLLPSVGEVTERAVKVGKDKKDSIVTTVKVTFTFCDGDTGQTHACTWSGQGEDPTDKGLSMAYTQALRYFLLKAFLISSNGESVSDAAPREARPDGQAWITKEQYDGIVTAYQAAGSDETVIGGLLDAQDIPRDIEGEPLSIATRCQRLTALQAIQVQKGLIK